MYLLNDLYDWYERKLKTWTPYYKIEARKQLLSIVKLIDDDLKRSKGVVKNVN